ncbi:MAG TPA: guanitoxin biosynthesis heme-dependent pre-guanitoxin N-hydroxylase GntA [Flavitalea sp.]|nr:guanitoxin biosynthesis heme-dependent pre-guanitoxin N-hydroxylase GntA [Flavitalea sp.]
MSDSYHTYNPLIEEYHSFIANPHFPCVAAKAANAHKQIRCMVAGNMLCPADDELILRFIYSFIDDYRIAKSLYHSATIIFSGPETKNEEFFDSMLWNRLQALSDLDALNYSYDNRVSADPASPLFSFSLKEEAFFVIGLHPSSSRLSRRFKYPTLVFNPHDQFELLRTQEHYEHMKHTVRNRDIKLSGSINPMLDDYGSSSETFQYSGRQYNSDWKCPLHISHANTNDHPST